MKLLVTKKQLKKIQSMAAEGAQSPVNLENLLTGIPLSETGTERAYRSYAAQVSAAYRKYNGRDELGNPQFRALVDIRRAFISGEGLSVQAKNDNTASWINDFLNQNKLKGSKFFNWTLAGEMTGKALINIVPDRSAGFVRAYHYPYMNGKSGIDYSICLHNKYDFDTIKDVFKKEDGTRVSMKLKHFKFVKLGGDDTDVNETTTKTGLALHECESYDRAMNGVRKNNHTFSRITPTFKTSSISETTGLLAWIERVKWKIGMVFAGTATLEYIGPPTTAHDNYKMEMASDAKVISMVTGIPIHWIGWVDLMSNRSTAEELYEVINNATTIERTIWAESVKDIIIKAQTMSIDSGFETAKVKGKGAILKTVDKDFEVKIPVINFSKMLNYVKALSIAFTDKAISSKDYMNALPGIDPYITQKELEKEKAAEAEMIANSIKNNLPDDEEDVEEKKDKPLE